MKLTNTVFLKSAATENTGGNCMADTFELKGGGTLFVTDEMIGIAPKKTWHDGPSEDYYGFSFEDMKSGVPRADSPTGLTPCGLTFVERVGCYEPDGPVSVDLLVLVDGRVLGIDGQTVWLYDSMEEFNGLTDKGIVPDAPSFYIEGNH